MLRTLRTDAQGFTLIELLVVILIIGVLAAIAIPSFLNQRGKAHDAGAKAVARTAETAEEVAFTDGEVYVTQAAGAGPTGPLNALENTLTASSAGCVAGPPYAISPCGLNVQATAAGDGYAISVTSQTGTVFTLTRSATGAITRTCDVTHAVGGTGGCANVVAGTGTW